MSENKIVLAGGSGFLGRHIARTFCAQGWTVVVLGRSRKSTLPAAVRYVQWDARKLGEWCTELEGARALVNLCGRSVDCRYNERNRNEILESRLQSTVILGEAIRNCNKPPAKWIHAASATIYADTRGDALANTEVDGVIGSGFSVDVCRKWEAAFRSEKLLDTERILLRVSIVLGGDGGAFVPIRRLARFGLGGRQGRGDQWISWIHIDDFVGIIAASVNGNLVADTYNCASPDHRRNEDFMATLRGKLNVPVGLRLPVWSLAVGARLIGTEPELILKSRKVFPSNLLNAGFTFKFPSLEEALSELTNSLS